MLSPIAKSTRNLSNPIDRWIDYMELVYYAQYAGSYEEAREKEASILATHRPLPLGDDIKKELENIYKRAQESLGG